MNRITWTVAAAVGLASVIACWFAAAQEARSGGAATSFTTSSASAPTTSSAPASQPVTFRVASYNINYGVRDARSVASAVTILRRSGADLIAVQEGSNELRQALARDLKKEYPYQNLKPGNGADGFALLSKTPLKNVTMLPKTAGGFFRTQLADVELAPADHKTLVRVCNVHLSPSLLQGRGVAADAAMLMKMEAVRVKEIQAILKKLPKDRPAVMLGDFNTVEALTVHGLLTSKGLIDSARQVSPKDPSARPQELPKEWPKDLPKEQPKAQPGDPPNTWHWNLNGTEWTFRVDYIFHTPHFRTTASQVFAEGPSDHYLIVSDLEIAE